jgi:transcription elongation factor B subunit 1
MADPTSEYVTLVSDDDYEFVIPRSAACISGTIRSMLDPSRPSTWICCPVLHGLH